MREHSPGKTAKSLYTGLTALWLFSCFLASSASALDEVKLNISNYLTSNSNVTPRPHALSARPIDMMSSFSDTDNQARSLDTVTTSFDWQLTSENNPVAGENSELAVVETRYKGLTFGGAYKLSEQTAIGQIPDQHNWQLGLSYGQDSWRIAAQYGEGSSYIKDEKDPYNVVVRGQYVFAPGISAFGGVHYKSIEDNLERSERRDATTLFIGTAINF